MTTPRYRDEIKGEVRTFIDEFESSVRNEIANADDFILSVEDTGAFSEYVDYLTRAEMVAAFKRAMKEAV